MAQNDSTYTPRNTREIDPMLHLLGMMGGSDSYITGMEAQGQREVVASSTLPTDAPWDELVALGFAKGEQVSGDFMFTRVELPEGWTREGSDHAMWSYILDERGIRRVAVFYKAAFYDRSAHANIVNVPWDAATSVLYGDDPVALSPKWDLFTVEEREGFADCLLREVEDHRKTISEYPGLDDNGRYSKRIERAEAALALIAGVSA